MKLTQVLRKSRRYVKVGNVKDNHDQGGRGHAHRLNCLYCDAKSSCQSKSKNANEKKIKSPPHIELKEKYPCAVCQKEFSGFQMPIHRKNWHPEVKRFQCFQCPFQAKSSRSIYSHRQRHHYKAVPDSAGSTLSRASTRNPQPLGDKNVSKNGCPHCKFQGTSEHNLKIHFKATHPNEPPMFKCPSCPWTTYTSAKLEEHAKFHRSDSMIKCLHCTMTFKTVLGRHNHTRTIHSDVYLPTHSGPKTKIRRGKPYKKKGRKKTLSKNAKAQVCVVCGELIESIAGYKVHLNKVHPGVKPFKCRENGCPFETNLEKCRDHHEEVNCKKLHQLQPLGNPVPDRDTHHMHVSTYQTVYYIPIFIECLRFENFQGYDSGGDQTATADVQLLKKFEPTDVSSEDMKILGI